jgi:hypothetical protein
MDGPPTVMPKFFLTLGRLGELSFVFCTNRREMQFDEVSDACAFWRSRHLETVKRGWALYVDLRPAFTELLDVSRAQEVEAVQFDVEKSANGAEAVSLRDKPIQQIFDEC